MRDFKKNDYAVNKYAKGIVYRFADGMTLEITLEDYLRENPEETENRFAQFKALSDEIFYEEDRNESKQTRKNVPISGLEELLTDSNSSIDFLVFECREKVKEYTNKLMMAKEVLDILTETQYRRYLLYTYGGLNLRQIAELEGVGFTKIDKSLKGAQKKIDKFLKND